MCYIKYAEKSWFICCEASSRPSNQIKYYIYTAYLRQNAKVAQYGLVYTKQKCTDFWNSWMTGLVNWDSLVDRSNRLGQRRWRCESAFHTFTCWHYTELIRCRVICPPCWLPYLWLDLRWLVSGEQSSVEWSIHRVFIDITATTCRVCTDPGNLRKVMVFEIHVSHIWIRYRSWRIMWKVMAKLWRQYRKKNFGPICYSVEFMSCLTYIYQPNILICSPENSWKTHSQRVMDNRLECYVLTLHHTPDFISIWLWEPVNFSGFSVYTTTKLYIFLISLLVIDACVTRLYWMGLIVNLLVHSLIFPPNTIFTRIFYSCKFDTTHLLWKAVVDVLCNLQRVVIMLQRIVDINQ